MLTNTMSANSQKKRKPGVAAFLSFLSMGTGQLYNGEFIKGIAIKGLMTLVFCIYALRIYREGSLDLLFMIVLVLIFVVLKIYSMVQAFGSAKVQGSDYPLKKYNRALVYIGMSLIFIFLSFVIPQQIKNQVVRDFASEAHPFRSVQAKNRFLNIYAKKAEKWPLNSEERMVKTSFGQTYLRISGPQMAPPLVLLHGIGGSSLQWGPNIEGLSREFRTYAIDNIYDNGRSVYTHIFETSEDFVNWLDELFDELGLRDDINLVGLSYGGWITSQFALSRPERLSKIALIAPVSTVMQLQFDWIWRASLCMIPHRYFFTSFMDWMLEDMAQGDDLSRASMAEEAESGFEALSSFKPKTLVNPTVLSDEDWQNLEIPVFFLVGENEKLYPADAAVARINRIAPDVKTEILPDCGHDLTFLKAETVNQSLIEFLKAPIVTFPFEFRSNYVVFTIPFEGIGPLDLVLDTGCQTTVLNEETLGDRDRNQPLHLLLGEQKLNIENFHLRPQAAHSRAIGSSIDGVIGNDIFNNFTVKMDFGQQKLIIYDSKKDILTPVGEEIPLEVNSLVSSVSLSLSFPNGKEIEGQFVIDTGAPITAVLNSPIAEKYGIRPDPVKNREFRTQADIQTAVEVKTESIHIGKIEMSDVPIFISTSNKGLFAVKRYAGIVGTGLLKNFNVTFDYFRKRLILENRQDSHHATGKVSIPH